MELSKKFEANLDSLKQAVGTFEESLHNDYSSLDDLGKDLINKCTHVFFNSIKGQQNQSHKEFLIIFATVKNRS